MQCLIHSLFKGRPKYLVKYTARPVSERRRTFSYINLIISISFSISSVVGCIDDTHIPIITSPENETDYCIEWKARWKGNMRYML